jgi:formiminotetrahydrofolate cyclodeaminase
LANLVSQSPGDSIADPSSQTSNDISLREFLAEVAAPTPDWSAGGVLAVTAAASAGLVAMSARLSKDLDGAEERADEADRLTTTAMELATADSEAYRAVLAAQRAPATDADRKANISAALADAAQPPLELARLGERIARLAVAVAALGKPVTRGDVISAALLGASSARSAAVLVRINLTSAGRPDDTRIEEASAAAAAADDAIRDVVDETAGT